MDLGGAGFVNEVIGALAATSLQSAQQALVSLLNSFGLATEPDFASIHAVYARMLAIALLLAGLFMAGGLIERITGGANGLGWNVLPRTLLAVFFAFSGLSAVQYLEGYAALLANAWDLDAARVAMQLRSLAGGNGHWIGVPTETLVSLVLTALVTVLMAVLLYVELIVRAALILIVTAFIPLVSVMSIWPRLSGAATHLAEFLVGLLFSKFVIATAVYIGFQALLAGASGQPSAASNWLVTGLAILLIAAFSPVVLVQGLRFTHGAAGTLARGWASTAVATVPWAAAGRFAVSAASSPIARQVRTSVGQMVRSAWKRRSTAG